MRLNHLNSLSLSIELTCFAGGAVNLSLKSKNSTNSLVPNRSPLNIKLLTLDPIICKVDLEDSYNMSKHLNSPRLKPRL